MTTSHFSIRRQRGYVLQSSFELARPRREVFDFFADAGNLEQITPASLRFRILTPLPIEMRAGALIDYRLRIHGVPVSWRTEITAWEPPFRFVDEQLRGPYRRWRHEHLFTERDGVTTVIDLVEYELPGGAPVHALLVGPDLRRIFRHRRRVMEDLFGVPDREPDGDLGSSNACPAPA